MRITWTTLYSAPAMVYYGKSPENYTLSSRGSSNMYHYVKYTSGSIHDVVIGPLDPNTVYYYRCGYNNKSSPHFSLKTPPAQFPIRFAVAGDLGQTMRTSSTLEHIAQSKYDVLLLPGDLSYANMRQTKWDNFGLLVQPLASKRPWMVTQGNHEVEKIPKIHKRRFTSYNARWLMPYQESASPSNLFYSFQVAGAHVIMLGSYAAFAPDSPQYRWLKADLRKVDRKRTPWLLVVVHAPWYNSNVAHQAEYAAQGMRSVMEDVIYGARVDVVFAGHVHAYERFARVYKDKEAKCGPVYITSGAGGNREGLARRFLDPKPKISVFRDPSFGHGQLTIVNATLAQWKWHRNDDKFDVAADKVWLRSLASDPTCYNV
ncbi:probable purple acid phosphatase 20 [Phtheirospermum japonicum]|uniref:Purple acid phosphatase n=1 Tax=Phtheirospermum japonicum TaxID=374723 RepID=A0A830CLJ9_9LAMI|nr:probable purple acid phosphatase 20 [Phtheirospermum japonicum]